VCVSVSHCVTHCASVVDSLSIACAVLPAPSDHSLMSFDTYGHRAACCSISADVTDAGYQSATLTTDRAAVTCCHVTCLVHNHTASATDAHCRTSPTTTSTCMYAVSPSILLCSVTITSTLAFSSTIVVLLQFKPS